MKLKNLLLLPRWQKQTLLVLGDIVLVIFSLLSSFSMRLGSWYIPQGDIVLLIVLSPLIAIPVFYKIELYSTVVRYLNSEALWSVTKAVTLYSLLWGCAILFTGIDGVPRSITIINAIVTLCLISALRLFARWFVSTCSNSIKKAEQSVVKRVVIYGAGSAGVQLGIALSVSGEVNLIAYIDDDKSLINKNINGLRVYASDDLKMLKETKNIDEILLAIPSASRAKRNQLISKLEQYSLVVRTMPSVAGIVQGHIKINDLKEISIEDLLGRTPVPPILDLLNSNITGKVVLVTGAGGSIGGSLCNEIIKLSPRKLILFDHNEYSLYKIHQELIAKLDSFTDFKDTSSEAKCELIALLGSVTDKDHITRVCNHFEVQTFYHAAAYKHVPLVEYNICISVYNNIFGTLYCAKACIDAEVETFVLISSDKAVRPTNIMGATKRIAEMVLQSLSAESVNFPHDVKFTMVRFGNVLGSSGSVIPLFKKQIIEGGPVTVTDQRITRYFMTLAEAALLVIQSGALGKGGDVFVLDMGEQVLINDLAKKMVRLSGLEIIDSKMGTGDIEIKYIGLLPKK